jgi:hydrogenase maturation protease
VRVTVIGVGTHRGDDAAGLAVLASLAARPLPPGVRLVACQRPLPDLLQPLADADTAVIVDAARGTGPRLGARRIARSELDGAPATSSHGFGVARVLALAEALGRAPARVELVAIEGADAVDAGVRLVLDLLQSLAGAEG